MSSTKKIWNTQRPRLSHEVRPETIHVHQTLEKATKISGSLDHGVYAVLLWEIEVYLMLGYDRLPTCRKNMSVLDLKTHLELHTMQPDHPAEPLKHEMRWYYYLDRSYPEISGTTVKRVASCSLGFAWWSRKEKKCLKQLLQKYLWHGGMGSTCISLASINMEFNHHVQNSFWHRYWDALSNRTHQIATNYQDYHHHIAAFKLAYIDLNQSSQCL